MLAFLVVITLLDTFYLIRYSLFGDFFSPEIDL